MVKTCHFSDCGVREGREEAHQLVKRGSKGGLEILGNLSFQGFVGGLGVLLAYRHEYEAVQWRFMPSSIVSNFQILNWVGAASHCIV